MIDIKKNIWKSYLFVLFQLISLGLIGLTGPIFARNIFLFVLEVIGVGLGVWAVLIMKPGNFNITPDPLSWSKLVRTGPYRIVRHPMYLALLLTTLPLIIEHFTALRLLYWLILLVDLVIKINYEEKLLLAGVADYQEYTKTSYRLIPFVY